MEAEGEAWLGEGWYLAHGCPGPYTWHLDYLKVIPREWESVTGPYIMNLKDPKVGGRKCGWEKGLTFCLSASLNLIDFLGRTLSHLISFNP